MSEFAHVAAYAFTAMAELKSWQKAVYQFGKVQNLKGFVSLSQDGFYLSFIGKRADIDAFVHKFPQLWPENPVISITNEIPYRRWSVILKQHLLTCGITEKSDNRSEILFISADELQQRLHSEPSVSVLDVRNDFEKARGAFTQSIFISISHFSEFASLAPQIPVGPLVIVCSSGMRSHQAARHLQQLGFNEISILKGGLFECRQQLDSINFRGEVFSFSPRCGWEPAMKEGLTETCSACQTPLDAFDTEDARFQRGKACPYCYQLDISHMKLLLAQRQLAIEQVTQPLPGSSLQPNPRPISIGQAEDGKLLVDALTSILPAVSREVWLERVAQQRFKNRAGALCDHHYRVRAGERLIQMLDPEIEPAVSPLIQIVHEDEALVVVHKPAPLPVHACGRFHRNTLQFILDLVYAPAKLKTCHRLDANTSGLLALAKTRESCAAIQSEFRAGRVNKVYLTRVHGHPKWDDTFSEAPIAKVAGPVGCRDIDHDNGHTARTDFHVLQRFPDGSSLIEVKLSTGRTNQIRLHLWDLGFSIVGDPMYLPNREIGGKQTTLPTDPEMQLLAWRLEFKHPLTQKRMTFESKLPVWAQ